MSEDTNPISEFGPSGPEQAREIAASLVRNNQLSVADANRHLAAHNATPLAEGSLEIARAERACLMADHDFTARYLRGDPDAQAKLNGLDAKIARGGPEKLTSRNTPPADQYKFDTASRYNGALSDQAVMDIDRDATAWATDLKLSPALASTLVSLARDADNVPDREAFGREQEQLFARVIGPNSEARLAAAQKVLDQTSTHKVNLAGLVKSAGAEAAIQLIHHAEHLATTRKTRRW